MRRISIRRTDNMDVLLSEMYDDSEEAETHMRSLLSEGSILESLPFETLCADMEEMHRGTWVLLYRRLVELGGSQ